jgi:hypothetical protein
MSSIDLSSAHLQVELHEESRKYAAVLFDSTVYKFKRVPRGFKNSLSAFIRALRLALGRDSENYVVFYVDDILVYLRTFEEHLSHLDEVIGRITKARVGTVHRKLTELLSLRSNGICTRRIVEWWRVINLLRKILKKETDQLQAVEDWPVKILKACAKMKVKGEKSNKKKILGKSKWEPKIDHAVLVRCQPTSDASQGIIGKFHRPYEWPYKVGKLINPFMCELQDKEGRTCGVFHLSHLKPYLPT